MKNLLFYLLILCSGRVFSQYLPVYNIPVLDTARSEGYYFLCALQFGLSAPQYPLQMILDRYGRPVYLYEAPGATGSDFKILPNGRMSYNAQQKFYFKDSLFQLVDSVSTRNGIMHDAHDIQVLPNGHILLLGIESVFMDLSSYLMFNQNGSPGSANALVRCGVIQELDTNRNVVFEWRSRNYYNFDDADERFLFSPTVVDWTHFNAVEMDFDGNILVSLRHFNEITKINRSDSTILWRLGGKRNDFTFTNDTARFIGQHDIRRIANGHILFFDNGRQTPLHPAAAKEYALDEVNLTATLAWSYTENPIAYSRATGGVQRLPNGNTLTSYGNLINANLVFNVVDSAGTKVFEISFPDSVASYRAFNYATLPWSLPRPNITCDSLSGQYYLDAGPGYSSYKWSTGASTRTIPVLAADTYNVFVPLPGGGYISSEYLVIDNPANPCQPVAVPEIELPAFRIYPNPVLDELHLVPGRYAAGKEIIISDALGMIRLKSRMERGPETVLNISGLSPGAYLVRVDDAVQKFIK